MSDPVRSLRVASTLTDRFGALLTSDMLTIPELELVIGEAQQIYPEIWRHLDETRTALLATGRDVSAFDKLRMAELGHLGVTNVEASTQLDYMALLMGRIRIRTVKTATFNSSGHLRAVAACRALMSAMPEVDWTALVREEDREIAAAGSLHASKWSGTAKAIAIGVGLAGVASGVYWLATRAPADDAIGARPKVRANDELREAKDTVVGRADRRAKNDRVSSLRAKYLERCDRALLPPLVQALVEADRSTEAKRLETGSCTPTHPSCTHIHDVLAARLAQQLHLEPSAMTLRCDGIVLPGEPQLEPAFAVMIEATGEATGKLLRGVVSLEGTRDLVPFGPTPQGSKLTKLGDIDDDRIDELVFANERELIVTRIAGGRFIDVGAVDKRGCAVDVDIARDYRPGTTDDRQRLVLVAHGMEQDCPRGPHRYTLRDGAVVRLD